MKMLSVLAALLLMFSLSAEAQVSYREISLATSAARTASGNGSTVDTLPTSIDYHTPGGVVVVNVTAVSGTSPSMTFSLEGIVNGINYTLGSCSAITAVNKCVLFVTQLPSAVRAAWVISGTTPSFTFTADLVRQ